MKKQEEELLQTVQQLGADVIRSARFRSAWEIPHHRTGNVALHSLNVAKESCRLAFWLNRHGADINVKDAVCSSLLHDIGMTEKHVFHSRSWKKAYTHPIRGAEVAKNEYRTNSVQENAIRRHMWPICIVPPKHKEGWVVLAADKICSVKELLHR